MAEGQPVQIGRYKILGELGRGGFGRVYRGYDPTVGRPVAIKILTQVSEDTRSRFRKEAMVAGNLGHKNIVTVYEYGTHEDRPFLAMEYLEGQDLHHIIGARAPLSLLSKCDIMSQVADGLFCAHQSGVVHRDMKPANIKVLRDGTVKIMDFGIARLTDAAEATRLTQQGFLIGTLRYMAPEQLAGSDFTAQCDIFAYGVIYYELLTGKHPFDAKDAQSLMYKLTMDEAPPIRELTPGIPIALEHVITRLLEKNPTRRYQSLTEVQFDTEPVRIDLRRGRSLELLKEAQEHFDNQRFEPAQKVLHEVLALEPSNRAARALREQLQRHLQHRTLQPRIESSLRDAEEHLAERRFADALQAFEAALALDRDNTHIQGRVEQARALVDHARKASELLAEARRELEQQNLTAAYRIVSEALRHDPMNPDAAEFLKTMQAYVERRQAEQRVDEIIRKAQGLTLIPAYDEAIAVLVAEGPEANSPRIQEFLERVNREKVAHQRKQRLRSEMATATDLLRDHRLDEAAECLELLRPEFPEDQEVAHLLAYAQKEKASMARAKAVESLAREARAHVESQNFEAALVTLDKALKEYPADSLLIRLLESTMAAKSAWDRQQALESIRAKCESLGAQKRFVEAVQTVEAALRQLGADPTLQALLSQLQEEWARQRRLEAVRQVIDEADKLLEQKQPEAALEAVQQALLGYPGDAVLEEFLKRAQDAVRAKAARAEAIDKYKREANLLARAGDFDAALALLEDGLRNWPDVTSLIRLRETMLVECDRRRKRQRALEDLKEVRLLSLQAGGASDPAELLSMAVNIASQHPDDVEIQSAAAEPIALLSDIGRARKELVDGNFPAALEICARHLTSYPEHVPLQELRQEAVRGQRRYALDDVHRRAAAEPDLPRRVLILEEATKEYPGETAIADELRLTRNRLGLIDSIVERARSCEQAGQWEEALEKWNSLVTIYPQYSGLQTEMERVRLARETGKKRRRARELFAQAEAASENGNHDECQTCLRQAFQMDESDAAFRKLVLNKLIHQAQSAVQTDWRQAEALVGEVTALQPSYAAPGAVLQAIADAKRKAEEVPQAGGPMPAPDAASPAPPARRKLKRLPGVIAALLVAGGAASILVLRVPRLPQEVAVIITANVAGASVSLGAKTCVSPNCNLKLAPGTYTLQATAGGYQPISQRITVSPAQTPIKLDLAFQALPQQLSVDRNVNTQAEDKPPEVKAVTVTAAPAQAYLEITGTVPQTQVRLDGLMLGEADRAGVFRHEVTPGRHTIELSKDDYIPLRINEQFRPGKSVQLGRGQVAMTKALPSPPAPTSPPAPDPRQVEAQEWDQIANSTNPEDFDRFLRNHPNGAHQEQARNRATELRQQSQANAARHLEQASWDRVDKNNKEQLQEYLSRFPASGHAQDARLRIADMDRQAVEALAAQRLKEAKDREQAKAASDEQGIRRVLKEFESAYNRRDLITLQQIWNTVSVATYRQQFREAKDLNFQLQLAGQPAVTGDSATAICTRTLTYRGQSGASQTHSEQVKVTLNREGSGWLIRSIELN
jgi:serine/threonine-protein kinase